MKRILYLMMTACLLCTLASCGFGRQDYSEPNETDMESLFRHLVEEENYAEQYAKG